MGTVLAGLQAAHDTIIVHEAYSATRADKMRFWARRWLVLDDMGQGSISCLRTQAVSDRPARKVLRLWRLRSDTSDERPRGDTGGTIIGVSCVSRTPSSILSDVLNALPRLSGHP